jgi:ComF family protein
MTFDFIDYFFPPHCISCWQQGNYLCKNCKKKLLPHPEICPLCHRFSANYETCLNCKTEKKWHLEWIIIPFCYSNEIKKLILKLKYGHKKDLIDFLTDRLILALQINKKTQSLFIIHSSLFISYVPSHRYRKYFTKGYNQSELLAKDLAKKLHLTCNQLVQKTKHTKSQAGLDRKARLKNLKNAFVLKKNILNGNETVLLVDDVTTTWSTLNQIAKTIKTSYPKAKIRWLVIARHNG